jgi:uncharacterized cupin superfamily protein
MSSSEPRHALHTDDIEWVVVPDMPHHHGMTAKHLSDATGLGDLPLYYEIQRYAPGGYQEPQAHEGGFHLQHVLSGEGEYLVGDKKYSLRPGSTVFAPPGIPHGVRNTGKESLVMFSISGQASRLGRG